MANRKGNASISGQILNYFRINKADIRTILRKLANNRPLQVTLCNLLGAGRFKTINDNCLMCTSCPRCKQPDSQAYHEICYRNNLPTKETRVKEGEDSWIKCLISYLKVIQTDSPAKYTPSGQKYHEAGQASRRVAKKKKGKTGKGTIGLGERIRTKSLKVYESKHAEKKQNNKNRTKGLGKAKL